MNGSLAPRGGPCYKRGKETYTNNNQGVRESGVRMGDPRVHCAAAALSVALLGFGAPAKAQSVSAKGDNAVVAAPGVVVRQEPVRGRLLYIEQKGGIVTPLPPPVPANVPEPPASLSPAPKSEAIHAPSKKGRKTTT